MEFSLVCGECPRSFPSIADWMAHWRKKHYLPRLAAEAGKPVPTSYKPRRRR